MKQRHQLKLAIDSDESITFSFSKENNELEVAINNISPEDSARIELCFNNTLKLREYLNRIIPQNCISSDIADRYKHYKIDR